MKQVTLHRGWTIKTDGSIFYAIRGKLRYPIGKNRLTDLLVELDEPSILRNNVLQPYHVKPQRPAEPLSSLSLLASIAFIVSGVLYSYLQKSKR